MGGPAAYWHDYEFDLVGNRTSRTVHATGAPGSPSADVDTAYTYPTPGGGQPHTLTEETSTSGGTQTAHASYGYDPAGNTTTVDRDGSIEALTWDPLGHLESITSGGATTEFFYDADGNRILRDGSDGRTLFIPGMEIHQPAGTTDVTATRYIDLPGGITYVETTGEPPQYQITDHHGTGTLSIDPDTGAVDHRRLDPYGNPRGAPQADWAGDLGFVGGTIDPTGYTHLGAREYDPRTGRFVSLDPIMDLTDPQQMHGYTYANNNPLTFSDPTGLIWMVDTAGYQTDNPHDDNDEMHDTGADPDPTSGPDDQVFTGDPVDKETPFNKWEKDSPPPFPYFASEYKCNDPIYSGCHVSLMSEDEVMLALLEYMCHFYDECAAKDAYESQRLWKSVEWASIIPYVGVPFSIALAAKSWGEGDHLGAAIDLAGMAAIAKGLKILRACSFDADTKVLMADGATKPISTIRPGDKVWAADPETGEVGPRTVVAVWIHSDTFVDLELVDGTTAITTTEDHPFWNHTDQQWQRADALDPGDQLLTADGTTATIAGLDQIATGTGTAYNLTVADIHTYYVLAGDIAVLVHNDGGDLGYVYLRVDSATGDQYVGQAINDERYRARQREHARANPKAKYEFHVLGRAAAGTQLDVLEESWIRAGGGPRTARNPGGTLINKRFQMNDVNYLAAGGDICK